MSGSLRVNRSLTIPPDELEWRFSASGGPGGQHANKAATRAEVTFDIEGSRTLSAGHRRRLTDRLGPSVKVSVDDTRSQARNREIAMERLAARLAGALRTSKRRKPTRPSRGAKERRLTAKKQRGERKKQRSWRPE
ncbi:MAG: alternative ribosome rescue aminoacyl-tRNA hydrolase ArfB [Actinomycetota bacterium]|nr:alternative ribosome rescue aminoacyl-tRNA hydrolase ArfB [Actinomycetota bacterium]